MDIDLLSKMVKELILDNDRVVLPGLGSFVAEIVPSSFSDKGYTINPPYRRLYFRSKPDQGGELAEFYASSNQVDLAVAEKIIADFVSELKAVLHSKKAVVFPGLGRLRATKENNVFFIADEDLDIYPAGFGLEPVSLKTHQETREEVSAAVVGLKSLLSETVQPEPLDQPAETDQPAEAARPEEEKAGAGENAPAIEPEIDIVPEDTPEPESIPQSDMENVSDMEGVSGVEEHSDIEDDSDNKTDNDPDVELKLDAVPESDSDVSQTGQQPETSRKGSARKVLLVIVLVIMALAVLGLIALAVVGRMYPEFLDPYLYTPEELEILNHVLK